MISPLQRLGAALGLCLAMATPASAAQQAASVLKIDSGPLRGVDDGPLLSYQGFPYAAPL